MKTFAEKYCDAYRCATTEFSDRMFRASLHRRAVPLAPLLRLVNHFALDRSLITACSHARSMRQVQEELECFRRDPRNRGWLRRTWRLRISVRRFQRIAAQCFVPEKETTTLRGPNLGNASPSAAQL